MNFQPPATTSTNETMATLVMHRLKRESEFLKIFDALGLDRAKDTAEDAVAMIKELIALAALVGTQGNP